jgi:putative intracellular protease/amidase
LRRADPAYPAEDGRADGGARQAMNNDVEPADTLPVDRRVSDAAIDDYDGLIVPGGPCNPDRLRIDADAVAFVRDFVRSGKPVAVICHGPWSLVEADVVRGRRITSWPSVRTDLRRRSGCTAASWTGSRSQPRDRRRRTPLAPQTNVSSLGCC